MSEAFVLDISRKRKTPREIGLVPMINVMLLMLIFFIVTGKITPVTILPVKIPFSEQTGDTSLGEAMITLGIHDEIVADDEAMFTLEDLRSWVIARLKKSPKLRFTIKADAGMEAVKLIDIMQFVEQAGASDVVLAAQRP